MKKLMTKKVLPVLGAAVLMASMASPAMAANTYTPVAATQTTFEKYLILDAGDSIPNLTFSFTVAPGTARPAANGKMAVYAGIGTPTIADVTFAPSDSTSTTPTATDIDLSREASDRGTGLTAATGVEFETGEKFAKKQATISFSGISFPEPGVYRYIISETADADQAAAGVMNDNDADRVLDVYVVNNQAKELEIAGYILHKEDDDVIAVTDMGSQGGELADKTNGFTNEVAGAKDLKVSKAVSGNQASYDKYFKLTVSVSGLNDADTFVVSLADDNDANTNDGNADATSGSNPATATENRGQTNKTSVTGAELAAGVPFYLQDGQDIVIRGLPMNANYTVTEDAEDYKSEATAGKTNSGVIGTVAGDSKMAEAGFTNTRNGTVPTGIILSAVPGVALVGLAGAGIFALKSKKKDEEE